MYICVSMYVYTYVYVCMCVYIYIYIYICISSLRKVGADLPPPPFLGLLPALGSPSSTGGSLPIIYHCYLV